MDPISLLGQRAAAARRIKEGQVDTTGADAVLTPWLELYERGRLLDTVWFYNAAAARVPAALIAMLACCDTDEIVFTFEALARRVVADDPHRAFPLEPGPDVVRSVVVVYASPEHDAIKVMPWAYEHDHIVWGIGVDDPTAAQHRPGWMRDAIDAGFENQACRPFGPVDTGEMAARLGLLTFDAIARLGVSQTSEPHAN
jgi:hypothetical protein